VYAEAWQSLAKDGIVLRFREPTRASAHALMSDLVAGRLAVAERLGVEALSVTVYLAGSEAEFRALSRGRVPHWGVGCAFPAEGVILLQNLPGRGAELAQTARHELAHIALHRRVQGRVPVWFHEGVAMWFAREWRLWDSASVFFWVLADGLVPLGEIDAVLGFPSARAQLAYTESLLAITHVIDLGGPQAISRIVTEVAAGDRFEAALVRATGLSLAQFEASWSGYVSGRFGWAGLVSSPQVLWLSVSGLVVAAYLAVRLRNRARRARWEREDPSGAELPPWLRTVEGGREKRP
jgi:hypothetical protein